MIKLAILIGVFLAISVGIFLAKRPNSIGTLKLFRYIFPAVAFLSLMNFFHFMPFTGQPHYPDMFHYFIGSKYYKETGYTRLYACVIRAEAESTDVYVKSQAYKRTVRDLTNDNIVPANIYFFNDAFCKARFSNARWNEFKNDIQFFHARMESKWDKTLLDHGFNPSPIWELAGGFISNSASLSDDFLKKIQLIDVILIFGCVICLIWAFDVQTASFAVIAYTALEAVDWAWCGRSLLRFDWFFLAVLSVSLLKRGYFIYAGMALGYAAMLRVFPIVFAFGPFVGLIYATYRQQSELKIAYAKFLAGVLLSIAVLGTTASVVYGVDSMHSFIENSKKYSVGIARNNVGLRTILNYEINSIYPKITDGRISESPSSWKSFKYYVKNQVWLIYAALLVVTLWLFIPAVVSATPWQALALSASFVPFAWVEISNYYYVFVALVATLYFSNHRVAYPLLGIGVVSAISELTLSQRTVENFVLFSTAVCIGFMIVWWQINRLNNSFPESGQ